MSETILKLLLSELKTVRLLCQVRQCGAAIEVPLEHLAQPGRTWQCPTCRAEFQFPPELGPSLLTDLARAMAAVERLKDRVQLEFVIPQKSPSS